MLGCWAYCLLCSRGKRFVEWFSEMARMGFLKQGVIFKKTRSRNGLRNMNRLSADAIRKRFFDPVRHCYSPLTRDKRRALVVLLRDFTEAKRIELFLLCVFNEQPPDVSGRVVRVSSA
jgi:hypothetical protein